MLNRTAFSLLNQFDLTDVELDIFSGFGSTQWPGIEKVEMKFMVSFRGSY